MPPTFGFFNFISSVHFSQHMFNIIFKALERRYLPPLQLRTLTPAIPPKLSRLFILMYITPFHPTFISSKTENGHFLRQKIQFLYNYFYVCMSVLNRPHIFLEIHLPRASEISVSYLFSFVPTLVCNGNRGSEHT